MNIKFDVYFQQNLGTLYKDNEIDTQGKEAKVDLDLNEVSSISVTFKVGEIELTDYVAIKDIENGLVQIPFKSDVIKQGLNYFELKAIMKNGDVKPSQTYCYNIEKSLENGNSVLAETNYPILIQLLTDVQGVKDAEVTRIASEQARQVLKDQLLILKTNLESLQVELSSLDSNVTASEDTRVLNEEARQTLNASLEVLQTNLTTLENSVTSNEATRSSNETTRISNEANRIIETTNKVKEINDKIIEANEAVVMTILAKDGTVIATNNANSKIAEVEATRQSIITTINNLVAQFNALAPANSTNAEVQLARTDVTGKTYASLQERLLADNKQQNILYSSVSGAYISTDSVDGYAKNIVIEGNTYQNPALLSDIRSTGTKLSDNRFEIPLLTVGKNMYNPSKDTKGKGILSDSGNLYDITNRNASDYIKVKKGQNVILSANDINIIKLVSYYSTTKTFVKILTGNKWTIENDGYIRFAYDNTIPNISIQLEEGTVSTSIENYQENKLTILSDVQIEKIGTFTDSIVQLSDGKWYIKKYVVPRLVDVCTFSLINGTNVDYLACAFPVGLGISQDLNDIIVEGFAKGSYGDDVSLINKYYRNTANFCLIIPKGETLEVAKQKVMGKKFYTSITTPTYYLLSDDQQIALRTFNNKTNILSLCEIEPTIKCDVPKSIGASVNAITEKVSAINKDLERVKKLEDATTSTVVTDNSFVNIGDSTNGYLSDLKLEGRTLNQIVSNGNFANGITGWSTPANAVLSASNNTLSITANGADIFGMAVCSTQVDSLINKKVFIKCRVRVTNTNCSQIYVVTDSSIAGTNQNYVINTPIQNQWYDVNVIHTQPVDVSGKVQFKIYHMYADATTANGKVMEVQNVMALDLTALGMTNYTADQINSMLGGYIEGLKSVGQDVNQIVVSSVGRNLFDGNIELGDINDTTGALVTASGGRRSVNFTKVKSSFDYYLKFGATLTTTRVAIYYYDINKTFISYYDTWTSTGGTFKTPSKCAYIKFKTADTTTNTTIQLEEGIIATTYKENQTDKKEILYLDTVDSTWKKPTFRGIWNNGTMIVGDTVEKKSDGKYSYRKRMEETTFTGVGSWYLVNSKTDTIGFGIDLTNKSQGLNLGTIISNLFNYVGTDEKEQIRIGNSGNSIFIYILKSKLTTQDVAGFKAWLQANPVTVVYQLLTELVYECTPIDLASYDSETNYYLESGVLSPRSTIKVSNFIGNIINNLKEKVSIAENNNNFLMVKMLNHEARLVLHGI